MDKKVIKVGVIGVGGRGISFCKNIAKREDATITALCDPNQVRMKAVALRVEGNQKLYNNVEDILGSKELDAVIITSPDYCHESNAIDALKKDIFVFIDKPLATTTKACMNIMAAAKKSKATVMMGFNLRHDPTLMKVKKIISRGDLGRIFMIENREFYDGGKTYLARWNRKQEYSGGLWIHKGSHDFDIFNWLNQNGKPVRVSAFAQRSVLNKKGIPFKVELGTSVGPTCSECSYKDICPDCTLPNVEFFGDKAKAVDGYAKDLCIYSSDTEIDVYDNGIAIVEYDNGLRASHLECFVTSFSDRLYTVVGTKGQLSASLHERKIEIRPRWSRDIKTIRVAEIKGGHGGSDTGIIDMFMSVIKGEVEPSSSLIDGTFSVAIGEAAEHSWREHRMVEISEVLDVNAPLLHRKQGT